MAECQASFTYTNQTVVDLVEQISSRRYSTYQRSAGYNDEYAFQLYLYNARLAKSFVFPLHVIEIVLRNGVDQVLTKHHGAQWHHDETFRRILNDESRASLDKAIARATKDGKAMKDDVVAHLTFDFWSNLFRSEYDRPLWQTSMHVLLPQASMTRALFQPLVAGINRFRNRIAHHEPIFAEDVTARNKEIMDVVGFRSAAAAEWLKGHSTVYKAIRSRPSRGSGIGPTVGDRCDGSFELVTEHTTLASCAEAAQRSFLICNNLSGGCIAVLDAAELGRYLLATRDATGLVDLNEHHISDVIAWTRASGAYSALEASASLDALPSALKANRFAVVSRTGSPADILGVIAKAHRRY